MGLYLIMVLRFSRPSNATVLVGGHRLFGNTWSQSLPVGIWPCPAGALAVCFCGRRRSRGGRAQRELRLIVFILEEGSWL